MEATLQDLTAWLRAKGFLKNKQIFINTYKEFNRTIHYLHWSHAFGELEWFKRTLDTLGIKRVQPREVLSKYRQLFEEKTQPDLDVIETLRFLRRRRIKVALLSDERSACIKMFIRKTKIGDLLDAVVVSEEVGVEKPHPLIFEEVKRRLGIGFSEMVMFGDSEITDGGGKSLGMKFVLVKIYKDPSWIWSKGQTVEPDYVLEKVTRREVEKCLEALEAAGAPGC